MDDLLRDKSRSNKIFISCSKFYFISEERWKISKTVFFNILSPCESAVSFVLSVFAEENKV